MEGNRDLIFKMEFGDWIYDTYSIEGLSVEEMNEILDRRQDALVEILTRHGYPDTATAWKDGYGIYGIKHFGGHLLVQVGKSCD